MTAFYLDASMPAEAVLFVASIARSLGSDLPLTILEEEPVDLVERDPALAKLRDDGTVSRTSSRVVVWDEHEPPAGIRFAETWSLGLLGGGSGELRLDTPRGRHRLPFVISPEIVRTIDRVESDRLRLLVPLAGSDGRRERMTLRVVEELRHRAQPHLLVAAGACAQESLRALSPDEWYEAPTACELAALLMSSSAVLDLSDESMTPSTLARFARCVGTRVILHASSALARSAPPSVRAAQEWSPDAFCDLIVSLQAGDEQELPWGMEFETIAEDFGRILSLG